MGAGDWNLAGYWSANHPTRRHACRSRRDTGAELPTRYETYRYEIDNSTRRGRGGRRRNRHAACCGRHPITTLDRRLLYGAILDCNALEASGELQRHATGLPVEAFASFFITEPISGRRRTSMVELVDITGKGGSGTLDNFLRDEAQLYR